MSHKFLYIFLWLLGTGFVYYGLTEPQASSRSVFVVADVVDGDTITLNDSSKVRLLGINTPEKKMLYFEQAKMFLEDKIENRTVQVEVRGTDRYGRLLAHVFYADIHINELLLGEGLATLFYYEKDQYYSMLKAAEASARDQDIGLWKKSSNAGCVSLQRLQYKESPKRCTGTEQLILKNSCGVDIGVVFKDDASHIYRETLFANAVFSMNFSCTFNDAGDSLYVWDDSGLILFHRYS